MTRWIRRLIEVNHTRADVGFEVAFEWGAATGDGSEMASPDENCKLSVLEWDQKCTAFLQQAALPSPGETVRLS